MQKKNTKSIIKDDNKSIWSKYLGQQTSYKDHIQRESIKKGENLNKNDQVQIII